jgi:hypothetical protein
MTNTTEEIDELIKKALTKEEAAFYSGLEEQSLLEMVLGIYQGKMKWFAILTTFIQLIVFGLSIYCFMQFLETDDVKQLILWGTGMFVGLMMMSMLKLFHWMQMDKNAIMRELKKVEFQVGILASKLK